MSVTEYTSQHQPIRLQYLLHTKALWHMCSLACGQIFNVEYRDGIKRKGDKIGMPCTHSTVI